MRNDNVEWQQIWYMRIKHSTTTQSNKYKGSFQVDRLFFHIKNKIISSADEKNSSASPSDWSCQLGLEHS